VNIYDIYDIYNFYMYLSLITILIMSTAKYNTDYSIYKVFYLLITDI
jgi:hypothetical protein